MMTEDTAQGTSRRAFIKGVVAAGAVASSSAYLFRNTAVHGQPGGAGTVERLVTLNTNGQDRRVDIMPQETLANVAQLGNLVSDFNFNQKARPPLILPLHPRFS